MDLEPIRQHLVAKSFAREQALARSRETIRASANAIRAIHRAEYDAAEALIEQAGSALAAATASLADHPDILHAGFVHDAAKEYGESRIVLALVRGAAIPPPDDLAVDPVSYLHGLAEAVGELRRHLLDLLRRGEVARCEPVLDAMDEMYAALVTIDFPDAMTAGLRRATDNARGLLERTRGDLTLALCLSALERRLTPG